MKGVKSEVVVVVVAMEAIAVGIGEREREIVFFFVVGSNFMDSLFLFSWPK
jgi:hypothetical protein